MHPLYLTLPHLYLRAPETKAPSAPKAAPPGAEVELQKFRPFLRFGADIDSDVAKTNLTSADLVALPKPALKPQ